MFVSSIRGSGLRPVKQIRVITTFPQLHENVEKSYLVWFSSSVHQVDVLHQYLSVPGVTVTITWWWYVQWYGDSCWCVHVFKPNGQTRDLNIYERSDAAPSIKSKWQVQLLSLLVFSYMYSKLQRLDSSHYSWVMTNDKVKLSEENRKILPQWIWFTCQLFE